MGSTNTGSRRSQRRKGGIARGLVAVALAACLLASPALAEESTAETIAVQTLDVMVLRPLGLFRLIAGTGLCVAATALWPPEYEENYGIFIEEPFGYVFRRPLGKDLAGG